MAHLIKYKKNQLPHILKHDERARDEEGNYIRFGNKSIDTSRTHLNYNLHKRNDGLTDYEYIISRGKQYLAKNVVNRDNVNWVGSWVITLPESLKEEGVGLQRKFFEEATRFLEKRYGYENIVGAYVHNDETTPHMHVKVTPVFYDEKKQKYRHSAKDVFDIHELRKFHDDLESHMSQVFGYEVGIKGNPRGKDEKASKRTIEELKGETLKLEREAKEIKEDNALLSNMSKTLEKEVIETKRELDELKERMEDVKRENDILQEELRNRDFLGRKKVVSEEISNKMELEIERRASRRFKEYSQGLASKSSELKRKEQELLKRERMVFDATFDRNEYNRVIERMEQLKRENNYLNKILNTFAKNVFKLSKQVFKEAIGVFKDFVKEDLLDRVGVTQKADHHEHKR